jgi:hypothetical protein
MNQLMQEHHHQGDSILLETLLDDIITGFSTQCCIRVLRTLYDM